MTIPEDVDEEYDGPASALLGEEEVAVRVHLSGHFDPLAGGYRWAGRLDPDPRITDLIARGHRRVVIKTPDGHEGTGTVRERNVWGGHRITGSGRPPFSVPEVSAEV